MSRVLNKDGLADVLAKKYDFTMVKSREIVDTLFDEISDVLGEHGEVNVYNFGKFETRERAERNGFNPSTKEPMTIKASTAAAFKPAKALREKVNK